VSDLTSLQPQEEVPLETAATPSIAYQPQKTDAASLQYIETGEVLREQWITDYFGNDYSIAVPILQMFIEETLPEIDRLETLLQTHGAEALRKKVHKINPAFKMVGQGNLALALMDLENSCITFEGVDDLLFKIRKIRGQVWQIKPLLVKQYNTISKLA
jgi:HPt (histidine-containing phosphotransfer) domain-containing protein